jgi:hypothetical protein
MRRLGRPAPSRHDQSPQRQAGHLDHQGGDVLGRPGDVLFAGPPHRRLPGTNLLPRPVTGLHSSATRDYQQELIDHSRMAADLATGFDSKHRDSDCVTADQRLSGKSYAAACLHRPAGRLKSRISTPPTIRTRDIYPAALHHVRNPAGHALGRNHGVGGA